MTTPIPTSAVVTSFGLVMDCQPAPNPARSTRDTAAMADQELHRIAAEVNGKSTRWVEALIDGGHILIVHGVTTGQEAVLRDLIIRVLAEGGRVIRVIALPTSVPDLDAHTVIQTLNRMLAEARLIEPV